MKENTPEMFSYMRKFEMHRQRNVNDMQRPALLKDDVRLIATLRPQIKGAPMMVTYSRVGRLPAIK